MTKSKRSSMASRCLHMVALASGLDLLAYFLGMAR